MDKQAHSVLDTLDALAPETTPDADDAAWLAAFRYQTALLRGFGGAPEPMAAITLDTLYDAKAHYAR